MPRIVITSDIHLGITDLPRVMKLIADIRQQKPDAVAIAGDIGEGPENIGVVLEDFARIGVPVAAAAGNHDVWNHDKRRPSELLWEQILPCIAKSSGTVWLDNENMIVKGIAIVGSTAWYDYSAQDPAFKASEEECRRRKGEFDADAWMVDWPWSDVEFCAKIQRGFVERLMAAQENPLVSEIVVVTHCALFEQQIRRKPGNFKWGFSNAYYGNLTFGKIVSEFSKVTHVISGHSHAGTEAIIDVNGRPVRVITLDSQYNNPLYIVLDLPARLEFSV